MAANLTAAAAAAAAAAAEVVASKKQTPSDFLKQIIGRPVVVKLNSGGNKGPTMLPRDGGGSPESAWGRRPGVGRGRSGNERRRRRYNCNVMLI